MIGTLSAKELFTNEWELLKLKSTNAVYNYYKKLKFQNTSKGFVEQYGKTPEFEASESEQLKWRDNQKTAEANDANHNIGTGSNFNPKNVEDSVSTTSKSSSPRVTVPWYTADSQ